MLGLQTSGALAKGFSKTLNTFMTRGYTKKPARNPIDLVKFENGKSMLN